MKRKPPPAKPDFPPRFFEAMFRGRQAEFQHSCRNRVRRWRSKRFIRATGRIPSTASMLLNRRGPVPEAEYALPFGQAAVIREGSDATVVALAVMAPKVLAVCDELAKDGLDIEVIDPRTLAPLDMATILESVGKTGRLLIADETFGPCGIGAEISAQVMEQGFDDLDAPIARLNGVHTPTPYSPSLEGAIIPDNAAIEKSIRELVAE